MILNTLPFSDVAENDLRVEDVGHVRSLLVRIFPLPVLTFYLWMEF